MSISFAFGSLRKLGWHWAPNATETYTKTMKCTWPTKSFAFGTQHNLYSTDCAGGFALGNAKKFASPNARDTNMLVFLR